MYVHIYNSDLHVMFTGSDDGAWELYLSIIIFITFGKFGEIFNTKTRKMKIDIIYLVSYNVFRNCNIIFFANDYSHFW